MAQLIFESESYAPTEDDIFNHTTYEELQAKAFKYEKDHPSFVEKVDKMFRNGRRTASKMIKDAFGESPPNAKITINIEEDEEDFAGPPAEFEYADKGDLQDFVGSEYSEEDLDRLPLASGNDDDLEPGMDASDEVSTAFEAKDLCQLLKSDPL
jgi:hypothetical protein